MDKNSLMMDNSNFKIFIQLGLTRTQTEVYLNFVRAGDANVKTIAKKLRIDRAQVYRALIKLNELGLVRKVLTKPISYRAIPLDDSLKILIDRRTKSLENIQFKAEEFIKKFEKNGEELFTGKQSEYILNVDSKAHIRTVKQLFEDLQICLDLMFTWDLLKTGISIFYENYKEALRRSIKVRIITEKVEKSEIQKLIQPLKEIGSIDVRTSSFDQMASISIFDKNVVDILTLNDTLEILRSNHKELVKLMSDYFELKWRSLAHDYYQQNKIDSLHKTTPLQDHLY